MIEFNKNGISHGLLIDIKNKTVEIYKHTHVSAVDDYEFIVKADIISYKNYYLIIRHEDMFYILRADWITEWDRDNKDKEIIKIDGDYLTDFTLDK